MMDLIINIVVRAKDRKGKVMDRDKRCEFDVVVEL